ncbi:hypothetical protein DAPPUDRAFT_259250 [Daphnia pulex]|uniref:Uncharacterized protein n=1 Tax=Daphnia pulex TaxID=6669 RepID=E9HGY2_DAPPU|nr:hypothetical protein DAPPUDRAFT_259250 [Daphnia pulex]|eukprot:EFX68962.1 hypothetical protein DAPPUDRAFT_259250 [Daphnia pulex]
MRAQQLDFEPTGIRNEQISIRIDIPKELGEFFEALAGTHGLGKQKMCKLLSFSLEDDLVHKDSTENSDDSPVPLKMLPEHLFSPVLSCTLLCSPVISCALLCSPLF